MSRISVETPPFLGRVSLLFCVARVGKSLLNPARIVRPAASLAVLLIAATGAWAQSAFGTVAVGAPPVTQTVTVTAQVSGAVSTVQVLTAGASGLEFTAGTGASTCSNATLAVPGVSTCTQSVAFSPVYPGLRMGAVVLLDSANRLLGTAFISGTGMGGLGILVPGNLIAVAGDGAWTLVLDGNPATQADLNLPASLTFDGSGNMYIADSIHNRIRKVDATTGIISTVAGNGQAAYTGDNQAASESTLNTPSGISIDGAGNLYIADTGNNVIRKITAATGIITTVAGDGIEGGTGDTEAATLAELNQPWGVTLDANGNLFIADTFNHRIRRVDAVTGIITTVAGNGFMNPDGSGGYNGDGIQATAAELNHPYAVAFDGVGNMYIPDALNSRVRIVNSLGVISTFAGNGTVGYTGDGELATAAQLWAPSAVIVDPAGNVYIADTQNNAIRKVSSATLNISTVAVNQAGEYLSSDGQFYTISIYGPLGLYLDGSGDLYFADYFNMRIREIQANFAALDFTKTPIRQGDKSATKKQTVENNGNAALDFSSILPDQNAALDLSATTCNSGSPYLGVDATCIIGAVFAPSEAGNPLAANIDVGATGDTANAPLDIQLIGNATKVNSTTVTVVSSLNPSGFGQSVTFTATVTTGAGTGNLTGTVTFYDGVATLAANVALSAPGITATATYTTSSLAVGTHSITASYSGDKAHFPNTSTPALIQIVGEATATSLTSSANPSVLGANVTFTATVTTPNAGGVAPDGNITFFDGAAILGNVALNAGGVATYSTTSLTNGLHGITAVYGGDAAKQIVGSSSSVLNQDVQAPSNTVVISSQNPSIYSSSVIFSATVTSTGASAATGVVNFLDGGLKIGTQTLAGAPGAATFTTSTLAVGNHTITAQYQGDTNTGASTSLPITQTVNKITPVITWLQPAPITYGTPLSATQLDATSGGIPGNFVYSPVSGTVLAAGQQTLSVTFTPTDTAHNNVVTATVTLTVNQATPSLTVATSGTPSIFGNSVTFTATITTGPSGSVTFLDGGSPIGSGALVGLTATFSTSALAVGNHTITASWAGNSNYSSLTSSPITQVVNKATPLIVWPAPSAITYGAALSAAQLNASTTTTPGAFVYTPSLGTVLNAGSQTLSVTFTPTDTTDYNVATATVSLTVNKALAIITWPPPAAITYGTALSATQLDATFSGAAGTLSYNPAAGTVLAAGSQTLSVTFNPSDPTNYATVNASVPLTVNKATPTLTVGTSGTPSSYGAPVTFTATISSGPTGAISFNDAGASIGSGAINGTIATFTTSALTVGNHTITASWPGSSNYNSVTSTSLTQAVTLTQTTTTVAALPNPGIAGKPVAITATVHVVSGGGAATGSVSFQDGATSLGTATLGAGGIATVNPTLAPGPHSIVATYAGDTNDTGSTSSAYPLLVQQAATSTGLTSTPNPVLVLAAISFTAKVTGNGGTPTGSVSFLADGLSMGVANLDNTGTATFSYSALPAGTHSITASYSGDTNDAASVSTPLSQIVGTIPTVTYLGASTTTTDPVQVLLVATVLGSGGPTPTGSVTFNNGSTVLGVAVIGSGGVATLIPDLPLGTYSLTASYGGDTLHSPSVSQPTTISTPPTAYDLTINPSTITMAAKQNATVTVTLASNGGFADTIGLGCGSLPAGLTCHFESSSVAVPAGTSRNVLLTVDSNTPLLGGSSAKNYPPVKTHTELASLAGLALPFSLVFGFILWRFRRRRPAMFAAVVGMVLAGAAMLATGCSDISQGSASPGTYVIQVVGIGINSNISHYQNLTVTITQ